MALAGLLARPGYSRFTTLDLWSNSIGPEVCVDDIVCCDGCVRMYERQSGYVCARVSVYVCVCLCMTGWVFGGGWLDVEGGWWVCVYVCG